MVYDMSEYETIQNQIAQLQSKAAMLAESAKKDAISEIKVKMFNHGISIDELVEHIKDGHQDAAKKQSKPAPIKYRGANDNEKWSGRGLTPKWLTALLSQGHTKNEFAVI